MRLHCLFLVLAMWAGPVAADQVHFQSPSGNIRCVVADTIGEFVRCDLGVDEQTYTNAPATCEGDWGTSFGLLASGPGFVNCVTGDINGPVEQPVLAYGDELQLSRITCRSEPTGITCTNADGGGFFVRRTEQRVF